MHKKKTMFLSLTLATMLICGGCGSASDADASGESVNTDSTVAEESTQTSADAGIASDNGTVTLTVWAEQNNFEMLQQMIDAFEAEYAGQADFEITLEENADSETRDNVLSDIHGAADVFAMADDQLLSLVAGGALYPVPNAAEVSAANMEDAVSAATIGDTLYAYPMTADNGYFMYYNKEYFTDEDLQTLDGMLAVASANGKKITMDWSSGWYLYAFFGNTGMDFGINDDGVTNYCSWNATDGTIRGVDVAQALLDISVNPGFLNTTDDMFLEGVKDGSVIAGVSGVWNEVEVRSAWGDNYGAVKLPTYTVAGTQVQMSSFKGYKYMGVNARSEHVEWAAKLADWLTNEENQNLRLEMRSQGPSNINASASDAAESIPAITAVVDQAQYGVLQRVGNSYWDATGTFGAKMANGNASGQDLQEIMDELVAGITQSAAQ